MIPVDGHIADLKDSIKEKCKNGVLRGVLAKDLTLWKVRMTLVVTITLVISI